MRIVKYTTILLAAFSAAALLLLVVGVPASFLAEPIRSRFAAETGNQLQIGGRTMLRIFPAPSIVVRDITLITDNDSASENQLTVESARLEFSFLSLFTGKPKIVEFALIHPVLQVPLIRQAKNKITIANAQHGTNSTSVRRIPDIERIVIDDGSVEFMRSRTQVESRVEHINIAAALTQPDHRLDANLVAQVGTQVVRLQIKTKAPIEKIQQALPVELVFEAPGLMQDSLSGTAQVISNGTLVKFNDLEGTIGKGRFTGWVSVDFANKPKVNLDLDVETLTLVATNSGPDNNVRISKFDRPWSDQEIKFDELNFVDAQIVFSASELNVSSLRLAPIVMEGALTNGVLTLAISDTGMYGGKGDGILMLDASADVPRQTMKMNLNGVRALPLLSSLAYFHEIDGTMQAKIDVQAVGTSQHAIMSTLDGSMDVRVQDGQILRVNIAQLMRSLTLSMITGWQENKTGKTDLSELSALFKIDAGVATTQNLKLLGPLIRVNGTGAADLAAKTLKFKLDTILVPTLEGQGGSANPVGFGVPVIVEGKWDSPHIYPDMAGILDNPDAAYSKLHDLGVGLFGNSGGQSGTKPDALEQGSGGLFGRQGGDRKDSEAPAAVDSQNQPHDAQSKINDFIKNVFGK